MQQKYLAKIYVTLRPSVLDPAGAAVQSGLGHLGYSNVEQIRIGKYIELNIAAETQSLAEAQVDRMCDQLLANTVVENYRFELMVIAAHPESAATAAGA
jgi:phosphoribosylformylglycinamidine synthase subunit PurS